MPCAREQRNARLYLIGLAASLLGNSAMSLAAGIWEKSLTGSSTGVGLVSVGVLNLIRPGPAEDALFAEMLPLERRASRTAAERPCSILPPHLERTARHDQLL
jgi:hypothetical protein